MRNELLIREQKMDRKGCCAIGRSGEHENELKQPCGIFQNAKKGISALNDFSDSGHLKALKAGT